MEKILIYPITMDKLHFYLNTVNGNIINNENKEESIINLNDWWLIDLNTSFFNNVILMLDLKQATEEERLEIELTIEFFEKLKENEKEKGNELKKIFIRKQNSGEDTKFEILDYKK